MMRLTMAVWWSLALVWLWTSQADAEPAPPEAPRRLVVTGYGLTLDDARKDALREAVANLRAELLAQKLEHWRPTEAEVARHLTDGPGTQGEDLRLAPGAPTSKTWLLKLTMPTTDALRGMDQTAHRHGVSEARMKWAIRFVAALALMLAVAVGCFWADEWTQARYTTCLRFSGASLVAAIAAGWWWMQT